MSPLAPPVVATELLLCHLTCSSLPNTSGALVVATEGQYHLICNSLPSTSGVVTKRPCHLIRNLLPSTSGAWSLQPSTCGIWSAMRCPAPRVPCLVCPSTSAVCSRQFVAKHLGCPGRCDRAPRVPSAIGYSLPSTSGAMVGVTEHLRHLISAELPSTSGALVGLTEHLGHLVSAINSQAPVPLVVRPNTCASDAVPWLS